MNLAEILGASARNNRRDEITGILAYAEGMFIQAVEGSPHAVDALMGRLRSDRRHRNIKVLGEDESSAPAFQFWAMETPKMRPDRIDALRLLIEGCQGSYGSALKLMQDLAEDHDDCRPRA